MLQGPVFSVPPAIRNGVLYKHQQAGYLMATYLWVHGLSLPGADVEEGSIKHLVVLLKPVRFLIVCCSMVASIRVRKAVLAEPRRRYWLGNVARFTEQLPQGRRP